MTDLTLFRRQRRQPETLSRWQLPLTTPHLNGALVEPPEVGLVHGRPLRRHRRHARATKQLGLWRRRVHSCQAALQQRHLLQNRRRLQRPPPPAAPRSVGD